MPAKLGLCPTVPGLHRPSSAAVLPFQVLTPAGVLLIQALVKHTERRNPDPV